MTYEERTAFDQPQNPSSAAQQPLPVSPDENPEDKGPVSILPAYDRIQKMFTISHLPSILNAVTNAQVPSFPYGKLLLRYQPEAQTGKVFVSILNEFLRGLASRTIRIRVTRTWLK